jgi:hypothetical protein
MPASLLDGPTAARIQSRIQECEPESKTPADAGVLL